MSAAASAAATGGKPPGEKANAEHKRRFRRWYIHSAERRAQKAAVVIQSSFRTTGSHPHPPVREETLQGRHSQTSHRIYKFSKRTR